MGEQKGAVLGDVDVMISYKWTTKPLVKKFRERLDGAGLRTWIDDQKIKGGKLFEVLSAAIRKASIVIICYSSEYFKSPNCRKEALFASVRNKEILFVNAEPGFKADADWFVFMMEGAIYYDITGDESVFNIACENIIATIREKLSVLGQQVAAQPMPLMKATPTTATAPAVAAVAGAPEWSTWSVEEVGNWLSKMKLQTLKEKYILLTFLLSLTIANCTSIPLKHVTQVHA